MTLAALCFWAIFATANSLSPRGTKLEQHVAKENEGWWARTVQALGQEGVVLFADPVHEEITADVFDCNDGCTDADIASEWASPYVIAGVRWEDDPPFRLNEGEGEHTSCKTDETIRFTTQPRCWYELFTAAKRSAMKGELPSAANHAPLLARSHFGDLQFFHSMASQDGETAAETQRRVMMWLEFAWRTGNGEYSPDTKLSDIKIAGFNEFFGASGWTVQDLYTSGNPVLRRRLTEVAFGSVLHTIEDSFPEGHVQRESASPGQCAEAPQFTAPPRIVEFHSYAHQDEAKHKAKDSRRAFEATLTQAVNVVTVAKPLVKYFEDGAPWETVKPYFQCIYDVVDPSHPGSAGGDFTTE